MLSPFIDQTRVSDIYTLPATDLTELDLMAFGVGSIVSPILLRTFRSLAWETISREYSSIRGLTRKQQNMFYPPTRVAKKAGLTNFPGTQPPNILFIFTTCPEISMENSL